MIIRTLEAPALSPHQDTAMRARVAAADDQRRAGAYAADCARQGKPVDLRGVEDPDRVAARARRIAVRRPSTAIAAEDPGAEVERYEAIIAANDMLPARFLDRGARVARAVGRITVVSQGARGTGFLVSPRLVMTNNHVIESAADGASARMEFDFFERQDGAAGPVVEVSLDPDAFFLTDPMLDFTLIAVAAGDRATLADRPWLALIAESGKAVVGERVNIVQHPGGRPQAVAIHENEIAAVVDDWLQYVTDTEPGSSGSPVLNDDWEVAALHHAAQGDVNEGARISRVVERIGELAPAAALDPALLAELLAARPPGEAIGHRPPAHVDGRPTNSTAASVTVDVDGGTTVTIPISVSVRIGGVAGPLTPAATGPAITTPPAAPASTPSTTLDRALSRLDEARAAPYYAASIDRVKREAYWAGAVGDQTGAALLSALSARVSETHRPLTDYRVARLDHLYPRVDLQPEGDLRGVYNHERFTAAQVIREEIAMEAARAEALREVRREGIDGIAADELLERLEAQFPFNTEHVVPQSWFEQTSSAAARRVMKSDLHHLFTCRAECNSRRSNRAYFEFPERVADPCGDHDGNRFEPRHSRAAVARAALYFLVRYPGEVRGDDAEMPADRLAVLTAWANSQAPSRWEHHRNAEIFAIQANRNPFVDFPDLVDRIGDFSSALS